MGEDFARLIKVSPQCDNDCPFDVYNCRRGGRSQGGAERGQGGAGESRVGRGGARVGRVSPGWGGARANPGDDEEPG